MDHALDIAALQQQRYRILGEIASLGDLRSGKLSVRYQRCGKPACHCQREGDPGHGPYCVLQYKREGRQTTRSIRPAEAEATHAQIAEFERLSRLYRELIDVSERLCDARPAQGQGEVGEKTSLRAAVRGGTGSGTRPLRRPGSR